MAEVHIVDIDGEQWDMKDLPLTQRVANLEEQVQENTGVLQNINKDVKTPFKALRNVTKVKFLPYETCIMSGFIQDVGSYMAVIACGNPTTLNIQNLYGSVSQYLSVTPLGNFEFRLSLNGPISIFGMVDSVS